jgi:hypothetical protein
MSRQKQNDWLVVKKSTTDVLAPAAQARRDGNVERLPSQRQAARRASRPQAATQLQHPDRESEIHFRCPYYYPSRSLAVGIPTSLAESCLLD